MSQSSLARKWVVGVLIVVSLAVYGIWAMNFITGLVSIAGSLTPGTEVSMPVFHYIAEFCMATMTLAGAIDLWRRAPWGVGVALIGLGMLFYGAMNALGWAVVNDRVQGIPMVIVIVVVLLVAPYLVQQSGKG